MKSFQNKVELFQQQKDLFLARGEFPKISLQIPQDLFERDDLEEHTEW